MTQKEKAEMGLGKNLIRFSFGFEDIEDLKRDITNGLKQIDVL